MRKHHFIPSLLLSIIFCIGIGFVSAASDNEDFEKANKAYIAGFYENAIDLYENILKNGQESSKLYYNLGNAYFKTEQIPQAILNFERALMFDPSNEDYQYNLKVANAKIVDKIEVIPELFYLRWWATIKQWFPPDTWISLALTAFTLIFFALALFLLSKQIIQRKIMFGSGVIFFIVAILSGTIAYQTYKSNESEKGAIVFTPTLPVKSSPDDSSIDLFVIHEGLKVQLIDKIGDWYEIRIANGSKGWVKTTTVEPL
ncbi:MAG: tetratricopeptide repeat protein [Lentimicrobium sp.]|jgi:tetratricopeptide (TPR) repeat protein|nr:tetratricopeptide repeat protein [Lentimicrobium sp.]